MSVPASTDVATYERLYSARRLSHHNDVTVQHTSAAVINLNVFLG